MSRLRRGDKSGSERPSQNGSENEESDPTGALLSYLEATQLRMTRRHAEQRRKLRTLLLGFPLPENLDEPRFLEVARMLEDLRTLQATETRDQEAQHISLFLRHWNGSGRQWNGSGYRSLYQWHIENPDIENPAPDLAAAPAAVRPQLLLLQIRPSVADDQRHQEEEGGGWWSNVMERPDVERHVEGPPMRKRLRRWSRGYYSQYEYPDEEASWNVEGPPAKRSINYMSKSVPTACLADLFLNTPVDTPPFRQLSLPPFSGVARPKRDQQIPAVTSRDHRATQHAVAIGASAPRPSTGHTFSATIAENLRGSVATVANAIRIAVRIRNARNFYPEIVGAPSSRS